VFLAWKLADQDLKAGPPIDDWPAEATRALQLWVDEVNDMR
jgi:hypothetical protein